MANDKGLGTETPWGTTEQIQSNDLPWCLRCGVQIAPENDSGWEAFTEDGRTTQKMCKKCNENHMKPDPHCVVCGVIVTPEISSGFMACVGRDENTLGQLYSKCKACKENK